MPAAGPIRAVPDVVPDSEPDSEPAVPGRVGPNAVIQLAAALRDAGAGMAERVFAAAGHALLLSRPPDAMVDEAIPARLFAELWQVLPAPLAARIARDAGNRTGRYVLEHRIPAPARRLLRLLPRPLAARLLLLAIRRNAWTFAGSGRCSIAPGRRAVLTVADNPLAMPDGLWHVGVLEALFRALVDPDTEVRHAATRIAGRPASRFEIAFGAAAARPVPARP